MASVIAKTDFNNIYGLKFNKDFLQMKSKPVSHELITKFCYDEAKPEYYICKTLKDYAEKYESKSLDCIFTQLYSLIDKINTWCKEKCIDKAKAKQWLEFNQKLKSFFKPNMPENESARIDTISKLLCEGKKELEGILYQLSVNEKINDSYKKKCVTDFIDDGRLEQCVEGAYNGLVRLNTSLSGNNIEAKFESMKLQVLEQLASEFIRNQSITKKEFIGDHIHNVTEFCNVVAKQYNIKKIEERHVTKRHKIHYKQFELYLDKNFTKCFLELIANDLTIQAKDIKTYQECMKFFDTLKGFGDDEDILINHIFEVTDTEEVSIASSNIQPLIGFSIIKRLASKGYFINNNVSENIDIGKSKLILASTMINYSMLSNSDGIIMPLMRELYLDNGEFNFELFELFAKKDEELAKAIFMGALKYAIDTKRSFSDLFYFKNMLGINDKDMNSRMYFGLQPLSYAVAVNNIDAVTNLFNQWFTLAESDKIMLTKVVLNAACVSGNDELFNTAIEQLPIDFSSIELPSAASRELVEYLVKTNKLKELKQYLKNPSMAIVINDGDINPLNIAISEKNLDAVKILTKHTALGYIKSQTSELPIVHAVNLGDWEIVTYLMNNLDYFAGDYKTELGNVLIRAASLEKYDICETIINKGCTFGWLISDGNSKGYFAIHFFVKENKLDLLELALLKGADANARHRDKGVLPLQLAVEQNNLDAVKILMMYGANVDANLYADDIKQDYKLLSYAAQNDFWDMTKYMLSYSNDSSDMGSVLFFACQAGKFDLLSLLLPKNPTMLLRSDSGLYKGFTPLHYAIFKSNHNAVRRLIHKGADVNFCLDGCPTPLELALKENDKVATDILLSNGADITKLSKYSTPLILTALKLNKLKVLKSYYENIKLTDDDLKLIVMKICEKGMLFELNGILERYPRFDLNFIIEHDPRRFTPLHIAVKNKNKEMIKKLLYYGADPCYYVGSGKSAGAFAKDLRNGTSSLLTPGNSFGVVEAAAKDNDWKMLGKFIQYIPDGSIDGYNMHLKKAARICREKGKDKLERSLEAKFKSSP